jgi:hypothetical protein
MAAPAHAADAPFTPRFAQTARGDVTRGGQHGPHLPDRDRGLHERAGASAPR